MLLQVYGRNCCYWWSVDDGDWESGGCAHKFDAYVSAFADPPSDVDGDDDDLNDLKTNTSIQHV